MASVSGGRPRLAGLWVAREKIQRVIGWAVVLAVAGVKYGAAEGGRPGSILADKCV